MKNRGSLIPKYSVCYSDSGFHANSSSYVIQGSTIDLDYTIALRICGDWEGYNRALNDLVYKPCTTAFVALEDFIGKYLKELQDSILEIYNFSDGMQKTISAYAQEIQRQDGGGDSPTNPGGSVTNPGKPNNGNTDNSDNPGDGDTPPADDDPSTGDEPPAEGDRPPTDEPTLSPDIATPDSPVSEGSSLPDLSGLALNFSNVTGIVETLVEFAQETDLWVDEALADSQLAQQLLSAMLSSSSIPEELQSLLEEAGGEMSQELLEQLLHGDAYAELFDLNSFNLTVVRSYLEKVAAEHGITFEDLISKPEYVDILRENLSGFMEASNVLLEWESLSAEEYQAKMLQIFDGDEVGDLSASALKIIREYIDVLSRETGIDAEEMLTDTRYAGCLKDGLGGFGKTSSFMGVHAHFSNEGITSDIGGIFMGEKPNVLGITDARWYHTGLQLMQYAEEHNISYPDFMIDPKYADQVKEILLTSDYTDDLSSLFKNTDSTTVQTMARRVYSFLDYHGTPETEAQAELDAQLPGVSLWMTK